MKPRILTVQETGNLYDIRRRGKPSAPGLLLKGQWLAEAGFAAGQRVVVEVAQEQLTIRPAIEHHDQAQDWSHAQELKQRLASLGCRFPEEAA